MKNLKQIALTLAVLPAFGFATSPVYRPSVAEVLNPIEIVSVGSVGTVEKTTEMRPYSDYLISIPVQVNEGSACTKFVGQTTTQGAGGVQIVAMGASDPVNDACIQIAPMPVNTALTLKMRVVTGGFVRAARLQRQVVSLGNFGRHLVTLDLDTQSVSVRPHYR